MDASCQRWHRTPRLGFLRPSEPSPARFPLEPVAARLRRAGCVFAEDEAALLVDAALTPADLDAMIARRAAGVPLEHVVGWAAFCGLSVVVGPGVFVPRRRTEFLAKTAIERAAALPQPIVVDLCCGSGAIAMAIHAEVGSAELYATDIDPVALQWARRNLGSSARVVGGDLFDSLPPGIRGRVDIAVANAPYVPTDTIDLLPTEARLFEPHVAVDGGRDGLDLHRRLGADAPAWLAPGGCLLVETARDQATRAAAAFTASGLTANIIVAAELDVAVVVGVAPLVRVQSWSGGPTISAP